MYTANTMAASIEAMGMSLPFSSSYPATHEGKQEECKKIGAAMKLLLERDISPKDIITTKSLENALTVVMALGGSTNAALHYLAIARSAGLPLTLDDIQAISDRTPFIGDLKPSGKYYMEDLLEIGGVPAITKYLHANGLIHGECMTVTGKTMVENLAEAADLEFENQKIIHPIANPDQNDGPHPDPVRQPGSDGLGGENHGQGRYLF